MDDLAVNKSC